MSEDKNKQNEAGCDICRQGVYGFGKQPIEIAVRPDGPTFLRRCEICGTYWNYTIHHAYPISLAEAREIYPFAFSAV